MLPDILFGSLKSNPTSIRLQFVNLRFDLIFRSQYGGCTFKIKYHEMSPHN